MWSLLQRDNDLPKRGSFIVLSIDRSGHWHSEVMWWHDEDECFVVSGQNSAWSFGLVCQSFTWWAVTPNDDRDWTNK